MSGAKRLEGKVAIVTASTDGIGLAIVRKLAQDGAKVMLSSRKQQNVDAAVNQLKSENLNVSGVVCHVGKEDHRTKLIEETVKQYGGIDILVSNAAVNPTFGPVLDTPEQAWDKIFDINVKATFLLVKAIVPHIEKRGGGAIVLVSSIGGYNPSQFLAAYGTSKTAMFGMTRGLMQECADLNIRLNCIAPGLIQTRFSEALWKDPSAREMALSTIPMRRLGQPSECAGAVSFLCSDEASFITGETIVIAGGVFSRL
ncbi:dehydrogenase/reductase SDR family member 4-like [Glandiceps talaboti]